MKIMFTSVGRRVELMQAFRSAAEELNIKLKIIGADITSDAPALQFCDETRLVCRIRDENYIPQLLQICEKDAVDCLIPTIDTDLLLLSENKEKFEAIGTKVLIARPEKVRICRDKNTTGDYFISLGLKAPLTVNQIDKYEELIENKLAGFPAFIKPKDGSSSIDAYKVNNLNDLKLYADKIGDYIIQPFVSGREFTIDIFCDYEGNPVYITPRERVAVRAGEVLKTRITQDDTMITEMEKLISDFKPSGQITVQLIQDENTGDNYYIEINPRFGGGAPLSIKAGADSAKAVLRMLSGEKLTYEKKAARDSEVYSRFDQSVCVSANENRRYKAVIFDLDDTLYSEKEYVKSGYRAVAQELPQISEAAEKLWAAFLEGRPAIDVVLQDEGIYSEELSGKCLDTYRSHIPEIHMYDGISELIDSLKKNGVKVGIITDGRPDGQRNKLDALGLNDMVDEIIITDEIGGPAFRKPNDISFRIMQRKMNIPFQDMIYIGDNANKDFTAPKRLGMRSLWFRNEDGVYYSEDQSNEIHTVSSVDDLINKMRKIYE